MSAIYKSFKPSTWLLTLLLISFLTGCNAKGDPILGNGGTTVGHAGTAPTATAVAPSNGAAGVPINIKTITVAFNKPMQPATLKPASFTLTPAAGAAVTGGVVTYVAAGNIAALTLPAGNLLPDTVYTATITTSATGVNGLPLASDFSWTFTTGLLSDLTAPSVIATNAYGTTGATSGATGLPINRSSTAVFSESMDPLTITTPPAFTVVNTTLGGAPVAGTVSYDVASKTVTFQPTAQLMPLTLYTSTITTAAQDLTETSLTADYVWSWTTDGAALDTTRPTVLSTAPLDNATGVPINQNVSATFSEDMAPNTITNLTFTLTGAGFPVPGGLVSYNPLTQIATFAPLADLAPDTTYTATIKKTATDLARNQIAGNQQPLPPAASDYVWTFTTGSVAAPGLVNLGVASSFGIAATAGVTNTLTAPVTHINGDVVLNPDDQCNAVTVDNVGGFGLCNGAPPTINGTVITPTYPDTTTAQAVTDALRAAYLGITPANLPGATPIAAPTTLGEPTGASQVLGDNLFHPGVYQSITSILITGDLTLDAQGDPNASFVFQSASTIGTAPNARILLTGGAKASNVWWQVGSDATLQTNTVWQGNILAYRDIRMVTGSTSCGRLFAGAFTDGAFVFDSNVVSVPGNSSAAADCQ